MAERVLIVGASVAGVGAALELRRCGFAGEIVLADGQAHVPYERPSLSKAVLADPAVTGAVPLHAAEHYATLGIALKLGACAVRLDAERRSVDFDNGERLDADYVIVATGARARLFPSNRNDGDIWTVRDADDATGLRARLSAGTRLAVIGGGFIGAEVASSARTLGANVTIFETAALPFQRILGAEVASRLAQLHLAAGVRLHCNAAISRVRRLGGKQSLEAADGSVVTADVVVAGLGSMPNLEWLADSGLLISDGVVCDAAGRTSFDGIFAAGDVANWLNPRTGVHKREEHWTSAREQGRIVAQHVAGDVETEWADFVRYFWSDMHAKRIQVLGTPEQADAMRFAYADPATGAFVAEYGRDGVLIGVAGCNAAGRTMRYLAKFPLAPAFNPS